MRQQTFQNCDRQWIPIPGTLQRYSLTWKTMRMGLPHYSLPYRKTQAISSYSIPISKTTQRKSMKWLLSFLNMSWRYKTMLRTLPLIRRTSLPSGRNWQVRNISGAIWLRQLRSPRSRIREQATTPITRKPVHAGHTMALPGTIRGI